MDLPRPALAGVLLAAALVAAPPALGQSRVGTTAGQFLKIAAGARYVGAGETAVATADGATALYWNPAGITGAPGGEVTFQHTEWVAGTRLEYAAGILAAGSAGTVGVHAYLFESGDMDVTTLEFEDGTGERFDVQDLSVGLSYAQRLTPQFDIGGTLKYVHTRVFRTSAATIAADVGAQYRTPFDGVTLGFGIVNFGSELGLDGDNTAIRVDTDPNTEGDNDGVLANLATQSWDLPLLFRIGLAYDALDSEALDVRLSSDAHFPNDDDPYLNVGAEVTVLDVLQIRAGASHLFLPDAHGQGTLRLGAGVQLGGALRADYAYADRGDLGMVSTIGASFRF